MTPGLVIRRCEWGAATHPHAPFPAAKLQHIARRIAITQAEWRAAERSVTREHHSTFADNHRTLAVRDFRRAVTPRDAASLLSPPALGKLAEHATIRLSPLLFMEAEAAAALPQHAGLMLEYRADVVVTPRAELTGGELIVLEVKLAHSTSR